MKSLHPMLRSLRHWWCVCICCWMAWRTPQHCRLSDASLSRVTATFISGKSARKIPKTYMIIIYCLMCRYPGSPRPSSPGNQLEKYPKHTWLSSTAWCVAIQDHRDLHHREISQKNTQNIHDYHLLSDASLSRITTTFITGKSARKIPKTNMIIIYCLMRRYPGSPRPSSPGNQLEKITKHTWL